nr:flavodoxin [Amphibacillus cookii]
MVYASMSGNTEEMAEAIGEQIKSLGFTIESFQIDIDDIAAFDLVNYDAILFGTYTWGDGELPYEVEDFHQDLGQEDLSGKLVGLFGSCDSYYPAYGAALEIMADQFHAVGSTVIDPLLKVDLTPDQDDIERCQQFANKFVEELKNNQC